MVSEYPGAKFFKTDSFPKFETYLNQMGFFKQNGIIIPEKSGQFTAKKLTVILTDKPQNILNIVSKSDPKKAIANFGYTESQGNISLRIYFNINLCRIEDCASNVIINEVLLKSIFLITRGSFENLPSSENRGTLENAWYDLSLQIQKDPQIYLQAVFR